MDPLVFCSDGLTWSSTQVAVGMVWSVVGVALNSCWKDGLDELFLSGVDSALFLFLKEGLERIV